MDLSPTQHHIAELIEETIYHRVEKTISDYVDSNSSAFAVNTVAGVEWTLDITVLLDNLGLNPEPKVSRWTRFKAFLKRTLNF